MRVEHAEEAWPQLNDDRMWTYFPALRPATLDDLRRLYGKWERGSPARSQIWLNWLCRDRASGELIGAMQATIRSRGVAYIAYAIYPSHQRKGYAREACEAVIAHLREHYGIKRVRAEMDTRNQASYRLVESLGFKRLQKKKAPDLGQGPAPEYVYELSL
jgi:ribosomal-protein-alanine N-acetyltransferase